MTRLRAGGLCLALVLGHAFVLRADGPVPPGSPNANAPVAQALRGVVERLVAQQCITPAVNEVFNGLVTADAFKPALGSAFTLTGGSARDDRIDLEIQDAQHQSHRVTLALGDVTGMQRAGSGRRFRFYLPSQEPPGAAAAEALLAAASVLDGAIPDSAFASCGNKQASDASKVRALASGAAQALAVVAALVYGLLVLRPAADDDRM